jgi:hypothetical protein
MRRPLLVIDDRTPEKDWLRRIEWLLSTVEDTGPWGRCKALVLEVAPMIATEDPESVRLARAIVKRFLEEEEN